MDEKVIERSRFLFNNFIITNVHGPILVILNFLPFDEVLYLRGVSKVFRESCFLSLEREYSIEELYKLNRLFYKDREFGLVRKIYKINHGNFSKFCVLVTDWVIGKKTTFREFGRILSFIYEFESLRKLRLEKPSLKKGNNEFEAVSLDEKILDYRKKLDSKEVRLLLYEIPDLLKSEIKHSFNAMLLKNIENSGFFISPRFIFKHMMDGKKHINRHLCRILTKYKIFDFSYDRKPMIRHFFDNWNIEMVSFLIDKGVSKYKILRGRSPKFINRFILRLMEEKKLAFIDFFIKTFPEHLSNSEVRDQNGNTILHFLCFYEKSQLVRKFLFDNPFMVDINSYGFNYFNLTPLHISVKKSNLKIVKMLIEGGININSKRENTPIAVCFALDPETLSMKQLKILHLLITKGSDLQKIKFFNSRGTKISDFFFKLVKLLIDEGEGEEKIRRREILIKTIDHVMENERNMKFFENFRNYVDEESGNTILHLCGSLEYPKLLKFCISNSDARAVNLKNKNGETPLFIAVRNHDFDSIDTLVTEGRARVKGGLKNSNGESLLHVLFKSEKNKRNVFRICKFIIDQFGADEREAEVNEKEFGSDGRSAIYYALEVEEYMKCASYMMVECNAEFEEYLTLDHLNIAGRQNLISIVDILIEKKIPFDLLFQRKGHEEDDDDEDDEDEGETFPIHIVSEEGNLEFFKKLIEFFKGNVDVRDEEGRTPLICACCRCPEGKEEEKLEIIRILVEEYECKEFILDDNNHSPLFYSIKNSYFRIAQYLLDQYEPRQRIYHLKSVVKKFKDCVVKACRFPWCSNEFIKLLISAGGDVGRRDRKKKNCLHQACEAGNLEIVKFLIDNVKGKKLGVNERDIENRTPLMAAVVAEKDHVVKYLLTQKKKRISTTKKIREKYSKMYNLNL